MSYRAWFVGLAVCFSISGGIRSAVAGPGGKLRLEIIDRDTKQPVACRVHLSNAAGRPLKAPKVPFWHDHFVCDGVITLKLPKGEYDFEIERGLEYLVRRGHFIMDDFSEDTQVVDIKRFADMAAEGWWSGDLDVHRPVKDLELLMQADDLHVVQLITWPQGKTLLPKTSTSSDPLVRFDGNRYYHLSAGRDTGAGGTLLLFNLPRPLSVGRNGELTSSLAAAREARKQPGAWVDAARASGWDMPLWVADGQLDSLQIVGSYLGRKTSATEEGAGRARDKRLYPGPAGSGRWNEAIYHHLLNCGLHIPPTAGSGSGEVANPLGYNRLYAHVEGEFNYERWWEAVRAGRVLVTNGPLIRPNVEGELPGHVFRAAAGERIELEIGLTLSTRDKVAYLEIVKNGLPVQQVRLDDWAAQGGKLPPLEFTESGWFVIRAVTDVPETYRFACTAPYYVEIGYEPRISKNSAQFFVDWEDERINALALADKEANKAALQEHRKALAFWQALVEKANAE